jgi:hypothetical protein
MSEVDRQQLIQFLTNLRDFVSKLFDTYAALFGEPGQLGSETWTHLQPNHEALIAVLRGQPVDDWPGPGQRYTGDLATLDREIADSLWLADKNGCHKAEDSADGEEPSSCAQACVADSAIVERPFDVRSGEQFERQAVDPAEEDS